MEFNTVEIRKMLHNLFSNDEIVTFCCDNFHDVYDEFSSAMTTSRKIDLLIGFCSQTDEFEKLISLVEEKRPRNFRQYSEKLRYKTRIPSYSKGAKGVVEFATVDSLKLEELTDTQKSWLATSIQLALANILQIPPDDVTVLNIRRGSIIFSIIMPVEAIWLLFNINKQNSTYFSDEFGLKLTFASGYIEPSEEIDSQSIGKSQTSLKSEEEALKAELIRRELIEKLHASKSKIISALWIALKNARRALLLFNKTRYLYRYGFHSLYDKFGYLEVLTDTNSRFVKSISSLEVNFQSWGKEIWYISGGLSSLIINLDALLIILQTASTSSGFFTWSFNPLSPFFILGYRKQRDYVDQLIKALEVAQEDSHQAAKLLAFERANYYETSFDAPQQV